MIASTKTSLQKNVTLRYHMHFAIILVPVVQLIPTNCQNSGLFQTVELKREGSIQFFVMVLSSTVKFGFFVAIAVVVS